MELRIGTSRRTGGQNHEGKMPARGVGTAVIRATGPLGGEPRTSLGRSRVRRAAQEADRADRAPRGDGGCLSGARRDSFGLKQEAVGVPEDQVHLAAPGTEIGGEEFQAGLLQLFFGRALPQRAVPQRQGQRFVAAP